MSFFFSRDATCPPIIISAASSMRRKQLKSNYLYCATVSINQVRAQRREPTWAGRSGVKSASGRYTDLTWRNNSFQLKISFDVDKITDHPEKIRYRFVRLE